MSTNPTIIYTLTDEAPFLATAAFLPIIRTFTTPAGIRVEECDISVANRILGNFPDYLTPEQRVPDTLTDLGKKTLEPDANIIKLPNISASVPQLNAAIKELRAKGYMVPEYPERSEDRRGEGHQDPLRQGPWLRRQPGAARRQLRPPRPARREGICPQEPAFDGRVVARQPHPCVVYARRRLLPRRKVPHPGPRPRREDGARRQVRQNPRSEAQGFAAGRRNHQLDVHEQEGAVRVL